MPRPMLEHGGFGGSKSSPELTELATYARELVNSRATSPLSELSGAAHQTAELLSFTKLSVIMPVYNERWTLAEVVRRVLAAPVSLDKELIIVDDCSSDGSYDVACRLAEHDRRIKVFRHTKNSGKGMAIRTAVKYVSGDVVIIQDADLEYDPRDYPALLEPILTGKADAVFGSRFAGHTRRVLFFWHTLANKFLTLVSNMVNDLNLTDMETGYKAIRADILTKLRLTARTFTIEPELTCRLAQWGARIYEVPISYSGRTYDEGKKIKAWDGVKALAAILYYRFFDTQFSGDEAIATLRAAGRATAYNKWIVEQVRPFLGQRILGTGAGVGLFSPLLLSAERLVLADRNASFCHMLRSRFEGWENVRVDCVDLTRPDSYTAWQDEKIDTIFCSNVLEHLPGDEDVLKRFFQTLEDGGYCILVVPAGSHLFGEIDRAVGHQRRYLAEDLAAKMEAAGFQVVSCREFNRVGAMAWFVRSRILRRRRLTACSVVWFERLLPVVKFLDHILPWRGHALIAVGRKPQTQVCRKAA